MAERTALYERHLALGGHMVDFAGWDLPQQYGSIRDEHMAVRQAAGMFDLSHMGRLDVTGPGAEGYLQGLLTNDVSRVEPGRAQYTLLCREDGGIIDDLVIYRRGVADFLVVVNASNRDKDVAWMRERLPAGVGIDDRTREVSLIAVQGPRTGRVLEGLGFDLAGIEYFGFVTGRPLAGATVTISRTGYTGEDGVEIIVASSDAGRVWDALIEAGRPSGLTPCGLGARDACRLEAALRLYGNDMDETTNPYEAGLGWVVKLDKGEFVGREALAEVKRRGARRETVGLHLDSRAIPRHGCAVMKDEARIGAVTSGTFSFWLGHAIAMAMVAKGSAGAGETVTVDVRGQPQPAKVAPLPFYRGSVKPAAAKS